MTCLINFKELNTIQIDLRPGIQAILRPNCNILYSKIFWFVQEVQKSMLCIEAGTTDGEKASTVCQVLKM